jgi:hypothetical protein
MEQRTGSRRWGELTTGHGFPVSKGNSHALKIAEKEKCGKKPRKGSATKEWREERGKLEEAGWGGPRGENLEEAGVGRAHHRPRHPLKQRQEAEWVARTARPAASAQQRISACLVVRD